MTVDHVGAYLYPDILWLRAIGRVTFPVWFFLVGFSTKHRIRQDILWFSLLMIPLNPLTGVSVFPLNALVSIIIARLFMNLIDNRNLLEKEPLTLWVAIAIFGASTSLMMEYGSFALMFACLGYITRHDLRGWRYRAFYILSFLFFVGWQIALFRFDLAQSLFVVIGMAAVCGYLYHFNIQHLANPPGNWLTVPVRFLARNSLHYYFAHRAVLQTIAAVWFMENPQFQWFSG